MATLTAEELQQIPHALGQYELKEQAARTGKKVKYYIVRRTSLEILVRYITPAGNITNGKGKRFQNFSPVPRFVNYWHAYAYKLRLEEQRKGD